jgi:hypothetical protein
LLLSEFAREAFGANSGTKVALKSGGAVWHLRILLGGGGGRLPIIVNIRLRPNQRFGYGPNGFGH